MQVNESVQRTRDFHDRLRSSGLEKKLEPALRTANCEMESHDIRLGSGDVMPMCLSALLLTAADADTFRRFTVMLHGVAEKVLEAVLGCEEVARRYFPEASRVWPYLQKTRGVSTWQVFGRHDVAIDHRGQLKLLELNTARPGGLTVSDVTTKVAHAMYMEIGLSDVKGWDVRATVSTPCYVRRLLDMETQAGIEPGAVGVLYDENRNCYELDLMCREINAQGRRAILLDTAELTLQNDRLCGDGQYLSSTHNRFRVSTAASPYDCWKSGFQGRYANFLEAQRRQWIVSSNNLGSHCYAGNKALLDLMQRDEFQSLFSADEQAFIHTHVPWTTRLEPKLVERHGRTIDLVPYVRDHREELVLKPTSQSSGQGVVIGRHTTQARWEELVVPSPEYPYVVQDFVECLSLPVPHLVDGRLDITEMFVVAGLAYVCGEYQGCISRVSTAPVINVVAGRGYPQAALLVP